MENREWARRGQRPFVEPPPYVEKKPSSVVGRRQVEFPNKLLPPTKSPGSIFTRPASPFAR